MPALVMHASSNSASKTRSKKSKRRRSSSSSTSSSRSPSISKPNSPNNPNQRIPQSNHTSVPTTRQTNQYSDALTSNPSFLGNRSPFYETISRHCVMPICQKQLINFQFNLPQNYVGDIKNGLRSKKRRKENHDQTKCKRVLHIRLFNLSTTKHVEWNPDYFILKINKNKIKMPSSNKDKNKKKRKMGTKSKGFRFIQPLDISKYALPTMSFEIHCHLNAFHGAASIEIVNILTVDEIAARVIQRSELASTLHSICKQGKESKQQCCKVCDAQNNLSRCSRCKAVWYCSKEHQQSDWNEHHLGCQPFDILNRMKLSVSGNQKNKSEDIICDEIKVSIKDPLSLCRIAVPIRGIDCHHPQCVDLKTYLNYCHNVKLWQCPICMQPLKYDNLVVDKSMNRILNEVDDDIDQVRLNPDDYSYKVVTLKEMQDCDGFYSSSSTVSEQRENSLKRRLSEGEEGKKKKRKVNDASNKVDVIVLD